MKHPYSRIPARLLSLSTLCLLLSCTREECPGGSDADGQSPGRQQEVTFEIRIPGLLAPAAGAYGMPAETETAINELTLLAYQDVGNVGQLKVNEPLTAADFSLTETSLTAKVVIPVGGYDRLVLIANANDQAASLPINSGYAELDTMSYTSAADKWSTAPTAYIPMSAVVEASAPNGLDISGSRTFSGLLLTRMLARVDIINASAAFTLKRVYLYNMNRNGTIVAGKATYGATPKAERLPDSPLKIGMPPEYDFTALSAVNGNKREMSGEIYVFEAEKADMTTAATMSQSARILVYGEYPTNSGRHYYYPVDFTRGTAEGTVAKGDFMPVVRNHHYTFEITRVSGAGFASSDDAMAHQGSYTYMQVVTHHLDDDFTDVYYDNQNYLAVNTTGVVMLLDNVEHAEAGNTNTVTVLTNADSFSIACYNSDNTPADPLWLASSAGNYQGGDKVNAYLKSSILATSASEFDGYIIVKAGRLQSDSIPVMKWWCGKNGIAMTQQVGNHTYKTHRYGNDCWMVENSREGESSAEHYKDDPSLVNGYYYTWEQATESCPEGWLLPNGRQWDLLEEIALGDWNGTGKWFLGPAKANNTYAGYSFINEKDTRIFGYWGTHAAWWSSSLENEYYLCSTQNINASGHTFGFWCSVRCVRE